MPKVLIPLAPGFEEMEAMTIIDLLARAGVDVITAGLDDQPVVASRGTVHIPSTDLNQALQADYDMVVLPGGLPGADNLRDDPRIIALLKRTAEAGNYTAAICAAPQVLAAAGLLDGRRATAYPGVLEALNLSDTELSTEAVVQDGRVITSVGPGTAMDFALELIGLLTDQATREQVEADLQRRTA